MAQSCTVIQADPDSLATALAGLNAQIMWITKTTSAGKFIVIYQTPSTGQTFTVIKGDPAKLSDDINTIAATKTINLVTNTFSASQYVVVAT